MNKTFINNTPYTGVSNFFNEMVFSEPSKVSDAINDGHVLNETKIKVYDFELYESGFRVKAYITYVFETCEYRGYTEWFVFQISLTNTPQKNLLINEIVSVVKREIEEEKAKKAEENRIERAEKKAEEEKKAEREAAELEKLKTWGLQHGSDLLKNRITHGFSFRDIAIREIKESYKPEGSEILYFNVSKGNDPTEKALALFMSKREKFENARYCSSGGDEYIVVSVYVNVLGREVDYCFNV
jgi:hypothetical protein